MSLQTYKKKRDFKNTPEPVAKKGAKKSRLSFVVQRHHASHLHYDFRLEMDGVLKSWAVPKGPSMKAGDRRLAVLVEDHPIAYGKFYGTIPEGNYGAGTVDIFDAGSYEPLEEVAKAAAEKHLLQQLKKGDVKFVLHGKHLKGAFALVRMDEKNWLLIKKKDEFAVATYNISKVDPIHLGSSTKKTWDSSAPAKKSTRKAAGSARKSTAKKATAGSTTRKSTKVNALPTRKASTNSSTSSSKTAARKKKVVTAQRDGVDIASVWQKLNKPMLAKLTDAVVDKPDWIYEMKYDGYRGIAKVDQSLVELVSRNGNTFNSAYPIIVSELEKIKESVILDGEIVIEDAKGISSFQLLQNYPTTKTGALHYYVFDLLFCEGHALIHLPLEQRKELLAALMSNYKFKHIHEAPYVVEAGNKLFAQYSKKGYEGVIAKDLTSPYVVGKRTGSWLKIKAVQMQEVIICGYTKPQRSRKYFGALVLGVHINGVLTHVGNCGTGFTDASLKELHGKLEKLITSKSPFENADNVISNKYSHARRRDLDSVVWVKPKLVCNVKFQEWTHDNHMRIPVFEGLRTDKSADEVIMEKSKKVTTRRAAPITNAKRSRISSNTSLASLQSLRNVRKKTPSASTSTTEKAAAKGDTIITVGRNKVKLTNATKLYWPKEGITKGDLIDYYNRMHKYILPYLKDRPMSLNRHPNGISGPSFYQKDMDVKQLPEWAATERVYSKSNKGYLDYLLCNDAATLIYMANLGCIEINPWHSRRKNLDMPDYVILDLDPGKIAFSAVVNAALVIKAICDELTVDCFCKTSGATGLHIYIPLAAKYTYEEAKTFAHWIASEAHNRLPKTTSIERAVAKRRNKVYLDYLQNAKGQTIAAAYSVRPRPHATVSTPLDWSEVNHKLSPDMFTIHNIEQRLAIKGDLWKGVLGRGVNLEKVLKVIAEM